MAEALTYADEYQDVASRWFGRKVARSQLKSEARIIRDALQIYLETEFGPSRGANERRPRETDSLPANKSLRFVPPCNMNEETQRRIRALMAQRRIMPCLDRYGHLSLISVMTYAQGKNHDELIALTDRFRERERHSATTMPWSQPFMMELGRLLHNYLAASNSLRSHCFAYFDSFPEDDLHAKLRHDIEAAKQDDLSRFAQDLRNYIQKYRMAPIAVAPLRGDRRLVLDIEQLKEWTRWSEASLRYMEGAEVLEIQPTISAHKDMMFVFQRRVHQEARSLHRKEFQALEDVDRQVAELVFRPSS